MHVGSCFQDPVVSGDTGIEDAIFDVSSHFLGSDEHAFYFRIVDGWEIGAGGEFDVVSSAAEESCGGFLETSCRDTKFQDATGHGISFQSRESRSGVL